jgi:hypothetical protein
LLRCAEFSDGADAEGAPDAPAASLEDRRPAAALAQEVAVQRPAPASVEHLESRAVAVPVGEHQGFVGAEVCLQVNDQGAEAGLVDLALVPQKA